MLTFRLSNPFSKRLQTIKFLGGKTRFEHKFYEIEIYKDNVIIEFFIDIRYKSDHSGVIFGIGVFGYSIMISFYDNRHFND